VPTNSREKCVNRKCVTRKCEFVYAVEIKNTLYSRADQYVLGGLLFYFINLGRRDFLSSSSETKKLSHYKSENSLKNMFELFCSQWNPHRTGKVFLGSILLVSELQASFGV